MPELFPVTLNRCMLCNNFSPYVIMDELFKLNGCL